MLNHCFDDIERFVGRLQQAADAFKELDKRRRGRSDKRERKYRHGGAPLSPPSKLRSKATVIFIVFCFLNVLDGMLTMRARPPPAKDFIDVFQKFKLSFNLLV